MNENKGNEINNSLNNMTVDPTVSVPQEDLTQIFNTPIDNNTNNLGVGEVSSNYADKVSENTEILDLKGINSANETVVQPVEAAPVVNNIVEDNPFEMNTTVSTAEPAVAPEAPVQMPTAEPVVAPEAPTQMPTAEPSVAPEPINNLGVQPNVMNDANNLNPVGLDSVANVNPSVVTNQEQPLVPPTLDGGVQPSGAEVPPSKKKNNLIIPIVAIVAVFGALVALYFLVFNNPKKLFEKSISKGFDTLYNSLDGITKNGTSKSSGSLSYKLSATDPQVQQIFDMINGIAFDYEYVVDYKNKLISLDFNSTYNNEKLINLSGYAENGKGYVLLKDAYDKYLSTEIEGYEKIFENANDQEDVKTILKSIEKALKKSLKSSDFTKETVTIKINGKDEKVNDNALVLTNENFNRISESLLTILKDDADFISAVNKISQDESVDTKAELEDAIASIGEVDPDDTTKIKMSIYTKGVLNEFVGFNLSIVEEEEIGMSFIKNGDNTYDIVGKQGENELVTGTLKAEETITDSKTSSDIELKISVPSIVDIQLNVKSTMEYGSKFNKVDVSNSIDADSLTEIEANTITTNLVNTPGLVKLIANFQGIMNTNTPTSPGLNNNFATDFDTNIDANLDSNFDVEFDTDFNVNTDFGYDMENYDYGF